MLKKTGWWFTFNPSTSSIFSKIISEISNSYDNGDTFLPHLSFYCYVDTTLKEASEVAIQLASKFKPFTVRTKQMSYDTPVHKTVFIETEITPEMKTAFEYMEDKYKQDFVFKPHISLIYKTDLAISIRERLCKTIVYPEEITIDGIAYYSPELGQESAANFRNWPSPIILKLGSEI